MTKGKDKAMLLELATRWLAELFYPSRKCERVGHAMQDIRERVYVEADPDLDIFWTRYVAVEATEVTPRCRRCGHTEAMRVEDRRGLNGLTMSDDRWEQFRRNGRLAQ